MRENNKMILNINDILIPKRLRSVDKDKVKQLAESIRENGLICPVVVTRGRLIAGAHRLEAHKLLGWTKIPTRPLGDINDKDKIRLIEIDENLFRNELSPFEKMEHIALRVEILTNKKIRTLSSSVNNDKEMLRMKKQIANDTKNELMNLMNLKTLSVINKNISDYNISVKTDIVNNKNIDLLTNSQLRSVIKVAREDVEKANKMIDDIALIVDCDERKKVIIKDQENKKYEIVKVIKKSLSMNKKIFDLSSEESIFNESDLNVVMKSISDIESVLNKYSVNK